jgi:hypothetical protein
LNNNGGYFHIPETFDKNLGQHSPLPDQDHPVVTGYGLLENHVRFGQGQGNFLHGYQSTGKKVLQKK